MGDDLKYISEAWSCRYLTYSISHISKEFCVILKFIMKLSQHFNVSFNIFKVLKPRIFAEIVCVWLEEVF